jgi:hypothetical protein
MDMLLKRVAHTDTATYGVLIKDGNIPFAVTLENPWLENNPRVSCIPFGTYTCKRVQSPRFGNTFEITGVAGRSHILFHAGNISADTLGCVLVGHGFDFVRGEEGIVGSKKEFDEFLALQKNVNEFTLTIINN